MYYYYLCKVHMYMCILIKKLINEEMIPGVNNGWFKVVRPQKIASFFFIILYIVGTYVVSKQGELKTNSFTVWILPSNA